jgi:hypothetical protein
LIDRSRHFSTLGTVLSFSFDSSFRAQMFVIPPDICPGMHTASLLVTFAGSYTLNIQLATPGGIDAAYYDSSWPSTSPSLQRIDSIIGLDTISDGSYTGFSSVRWSGRLQSPISGFHTFYVTSPNGARLWMDGVLVLDRWSASCNLTATTFSLQADALHAVQLDAKLPPVPSPITFEWASSAFSRQAVLPSQLFSTAHISGSPFALLVQPAAACAAASSALLRGAANLKAFLHNNLRHVVVI